MNTKIIITSAKSINKLELAKNIKENLNESYTIANTFTSEKNTQNENDIYLDINTINLSYKNNALLCVTSDNNILNGITYDDFENNDITYVSLEQFNMISDYIFNKYDILILWIDVKKDYSKELLTESKFLLERLNTLKYMYFTEKDIDIIPLIVKKYINTDDLKEKNLILTENS